MTHPHRDPSSVTLESARRPFPKLPYLTTSLCPISLQLPRLAFSNEYFFFFFPYDCLDLIFYFFLRNPSRNPKLFFGHPKNRPSPFQRDLSQQVPSAAGTKMGELSKRHPVGTGANLGAVFEVRTAPLNSTARRRLSNPMVPEEICGTRWIPLPRTVMGFLSQMVNERMAMGSIGSVHPGRIVCRENLAFCLQTAESQGSLCVCVCVCV